jgi:hypothetical protein
VQDIDSGVQTDTLTKLTTLTVRGYDTIVIMGLVVKKFFDILGNKVVKH